MARNNPREDEPPKNKILPLVIQKTSSGQQAVVQQAKTCGHKCPTLRRWRVNDPTQTKQRPTPRRTWRLLHLLLLSSFPLLFTPNVSRSSSHLRRMRAPSYVAASSHRIHQRTEAARNLRVLPFRWWEKFMGCWLRSFSQDAGKQSPANDIQRKFMANSGFTLSAHQQARVAYGPYLRHS